MATPTACAVPLLVALRYTAYDVTANITGTKGAWLGSWNIQSDGAQFEECGWPAFIEQTRAWGGDDIANDYTHCCQARALLMQRLQVSALCLCIRCVCLTLMQESVVTLEDFQAMCRHNDYMHDPESKCNCSAQVRGRNMQSFSFLFCHAS